MHYGANSAHQIWNFILFIVSKSLIMRVTKGKHRLINIFVVAYLTVLSGTVNSEVASETVQSTNIYTQQSFPSAPSDLTRTYYADVENKLEPLPFEKGITSANVFAIARDNATFRVKLNGPKSATLLQHSNHTFYVFVADKMDPPPHLLVRLTSKKSSRQFTITLIKGRKGYAPLNEENIRLDYRVLERLRVETGRGRILFVNYMEIRPRQRLQPGEYAIIGDSLSDIATFSIE